jgi:hypothetical protein
MIRPITLIVAKIVTIIAIAWITMYFAPALALFGFVPLLGSLAGAVFFTRRERRALTPASAPTVVFATWVGVWFLVLMLAASRPSREVVDMSWIGAVTRPLAGEAEVRLEPRDQHGLRAVIISSQLHRYLAERGKPTVPVTFEVDRHFGCASGFRIIRIGDLDSWNEMTSQFVYAGAVSDPWKSPFWCRRS